MSARYNDERTDLLNGRISFLFLMLTQLTIGGIIVYKRYILGLPASEYAELSWLLGLSIAGYWAARLYFSGSLPLIPLRKLALIYIGLVAAISIPTYLIHGWPQPEKWYEVLYPFAGSAAALGLYTLAAYSGKRRLEKMLS